MAFDEGDKALVESIAAKLMTAKGYQTEKICDEKMKEVGHLKDHMKSNDRKQWAIILLLIGIFVKVTVKFWGW